jgi:5-methylcytosine-specific restriction endonuclease McrA
MNATQKDSAMMNPKQKRMNSKQKKQAKTKLIDRFGSVCFWCSKPLSATQRTIDHLIPLSQGGSNNFENLRLACPCCNKERGNSLFPPKAIELK